MGVLSALWCIFSVFHIISPSLTRLLLWCYIAYTFSLGGTWDTADLGNMFVMVCWRAFGTFSFP